MIPSLKSAIRRLDKQIRRWSISEKPYKGNKCPVCKAECKYDTDFMEHIMLEEHINCPNNCYSYMFVTGSTETRIGSVIVHGHYTDTDKDRVYQDRVINLALINERGKHIEKAKSGRTSLLRDS
jgi:hypothetical protein